jgi:DNA-directed RNA polymerase specialized sigma24 family protein
MLAKRAADLRRRIFSSLPWGFRVASFFLRLSSGIIDAFGRVVAAEFIKRGVEGLEPIGDEPALAWQDKLKALGSRAGDKLPKSYGRKFAQMAWNVVLGKSRNPEVVEEAMTLVIEKLLKNPTVIREGAMRQEAEGFILKMLKNEATDLLRSKGRRQQREESLVVEDEGESVSRDFMDPSALREIGEMLPEREIREIIRDLDRLHPNAATYIELVFQGYEDREIAENAMLPQMDRAVSPQALFNWKKRWLPKIKEVVLQHIQAA